eukprot:3602974-Alexandrium_andersonii.AAC.1
MDELTLVTMASNSRSRFGFCHCSSRVGKILSAATPATPPSSESSSFMPRGDAAASPEAEAAAEAAPLWLGDAAA